MEVTGKTLLNSAQNILKNKNQENSRSRESTSTSSETRIESELNSTLNVQVLRLQAALSLAQKDHSRSQAQLSFLNSNDQTPPNQIMFDEKPLFPEYPFQKNLDDYKKEISNDVVQMAKKLKGLQVEMENVFAFKFETTPDMNLNADSLALAKGLTSLDPDRVAKLTLT